MALDPLADYSHLPRRKFLGRPLTRAQLLLSHRDATTPYHRFEKWWWGTPTAKARPAHYVVSAFDTALNRPMLFSRQVDIMFWREPPVNRMYSTTTSACEALTHQGNVKMQEEKLLDAGNFYLSLN